MRWINKLKNIIMKTKVVHSQSKKAWNVIGLELGGKYKIARFPYEDFERERKESFEHATFVSKCFNDKYKKSNVEIKGSDLILVLSNTLKRKNTL